MNIVLVVTEIILVAALIYYFVTENKRRVENQRRDQEELQRRQDLLNKEVEAQRKSLVVEAREEALRLKGELEAEEREQRAELQRLERRLSQREEALERRVETIEAREGGIASREKELAEALEESRQVYAKGQAALEKVAGLTAEEAKAQLLRNIEDEVQRDAAKLIRETEERAKADADRIARKIVTLAIQRCAVDTVSESTVSVVPLPTDDMKGRIIGREGRNIRAFETMTGVDLIIDDTPEAVVLSAFDPVRREIARLALNALVADGRIHPGRIEETIERARAEVETKVRDAGESAVMDAGVTGLHPELTRVLGKLRYRSSYGQNVLDHSVEMAHLAGALAAELGANVQLAKRSALLHDIGKAVDFETEGAHHHISMDLARRYGEPEEVIHAIGAHHDDIEPETVEAMLVRIADALSAARPGARRENLEAYIKRLTQLEAIADSFEGVEKAYAVQAGREVRIMVRPTVVDDVKATTLAREVSRCIEEQMQYPGQIKVTVIRETRAVEFAK
ncbi:MAG: ribonuclease Y [Armatimonadetes bacterium]|nr:ribonuclease Y [Armatimonadota bacterium]